MRPSTKAPKDNDKIGTDVKQTFKTRKSHTTVPRYRDSVYLKKSIFKNDLTKHFDTRVKISEKLKASLPFFNSRLASGTMLSYLGFRH